MQIEEIGRNIVRYESRRKIINLIESLDRYIKEDTEEAEELYREAVKNMKRG